MVDRTVVMEETKTQQIDPAGGRTPGKSGETPSRYTFDRVVRMILSTLGIIATVLLLRYLSDVLIPFAVAVVLAYLLNPLVNIFEQKTKRRGLAVGITIGGLLILGLSISVLVFPLIYGQVTRFGRDIRKIREDFGASVQFHIPPPPERLPEFVGPVPDVPKSTMGLRELKEGWIQFQSDPTTPRSERFARLRVAVSDSFVGELLEAGIRYTNSDEFRIHLTYAAKRLAESGWSVLTFALNMVIGLTVLILVILYLIFLLLDYPEYVKTWRAFLPPLYREGLVEFLFEFDSILRRYLRGQFVVSLLYGAFLSAGFWAIGLPMALPIGLFVGFLSMVPYLQTIGLIPALALAVVRSIEENTSLLASAALTISVFGGVQMLQDWLITPRIMGKAVGLRPVAILLGVFIWGRLLGFLGLLLAIPLTCLGIAYYRRYVLHQPGRLAPPRTDG